MLSCTHFERRVEEQAQSSVPLVPEATGVGVHHETGLVAAWVLLLHVLLIPGSAELLVGGAK
eukprot:1749578-Amphidinium_carterae.1